VPFMYPRVKRVRRGDQLHEYVQLVEGHRVDGKVRQRVVATLGRLDVLKATGQLDRWAGAFARLDPPPVGTRREVGPLLLVTHYLRRLGLTELVDAAAPMRGRSLLTHGVRPRRRRRLAPESSGARRLAVKWIANLAI